MIIIKNIIREHGLGLEEKECQGYLISTLKKEWRIHIKTITEQQFCDYVSKIPELKSNRLADYVKTETIENLYKFFFDKDDSFSDMELCKALLISRQQIISMSPISPGIIEAKKIVIMAIESAIFSSMKMVTLMTDILKNSPNTDKH